MGKMLNITPTQKNGAYADIIAFLSGMAAQFGSATNAAAVLLRRTPEFEHWSRDREAAKRSSKRKAG